MASRQNAQPGEADAGAPPAIGAPDAELGDEFWVGDWRVEPARNRISNDEGEERRLEPQLASLLSFFAERRGDVVTKDEILEGVWGTRHVADSALTRAIAELRRGLGDEAHNPRYIETIPKRGYRLLAEVRRKPAPALSSPPAWRRRLPTALVIAMLVLAGVVAADLAQRPEPPQPVAAAPAERRVAVLPLVDLSGEASEEYFAEAMTDALITALARVPSLSVTSRRSVERFKDSAATSPEIAHDLGVEMLLEGTVLRDPNQVRITVQLVDPLAENNLWAGSYERPLRDVVSLQGEIVSAIANEIKISLGAEARRDLAGRVVNPRAHDLYLRGRYLLTPGTGRRMSDAPELFRTALEIDPTYAPAWSGIADYYTQRAGHRPLEADEAYPKAKQAALEALSLDPSLAEAHASLGSVVFLHEWDWEQAERHFRRALELNPSEAGVRRQYAFFLTCLGRFDEAIIQSTEAIRLDPLTEDQRTGLGWIYLNAGRYEDSLRVLSEALPRGTWSEVARTYIAWNHALAGRLDEAIALLSAEDAPGGGLLRRAALGWALGRAGRREEADEIQRFVEERVNQGADPYMAAVIPAALGDVPGAMGWLEKAYEQHSPSLIHLKIEPFFGALREAPEYLQLVERMKL